MKKLYYIIPILLLSSCNFISRHSDGVVAEVNGHLLYQIDLESITSSATSPEDSAQRARDFIEQWATDILVYDEAKKLNTDRIEMLVEDYRRSLYIYEYEQHLVNKQMSHDVQDSTITLFYEQTKHHYILQDHIFKGILLVLPHSTPQLDQLKKWLNALNEDNMEKIEKYAYQYASGYELFNDSWVTANQILLRLPIQTDILKTSLRQNSTIQVEDSLSTYILHVTDKHFAGEVMPLEYARPEITKWILSQKQVKFLQDERKEVYENAIRFKKIKIYK